MNTLFSAKKKIDGFRRKLEKNEGGQIFFNQFPC